MTIICRPQCLFMCVVNLDMHLIMLASQRVNMVWMCHHLLLRDETGWNPGGTSGMTTVQK